jgi:hypothetical protein
VAKNTANSFTHAAYCMRHTGGSLTQTAVLAQPGDQFRGRHFGSTDWDPQQYKLECGMSEVVSGVSQSVSGKLHAVRCSSGMNLAGSACEVRVVDGGSGYSGQYGDWDYGYYKADCPKNKVMVGLSVNPSSGQVHAVACCN